MKSPTAAERSPRARAIYISGVRHVAAAFFYQIFPKPRCLAAPSGRGSAAGLWAAQASFAKQAKQNFIFNRRNRQCLGPLIYNICNFASRKTLDVKKGYITPSAGPAGLVTISQLGRGTLVAASEPAAFWGQRGGGERRGGLLSVRPEKHTERADFQTHQ